MLYGLPPHQNELAGWLQDSVDHSVTSILDHISVDQVSSIHQKQRIITPPLIPIIWSCGSWSAMWALKDMTKASRSLGHGVLEDVYQAVLGGRVQICSICWLPWHNYSLFGWSEATNVISLKSGLEGDPGGEESRWRRNRTGRSLSLLQIHRKNNRTVNKVYKTTSDR